MLTMMKRNSANFSLSSGEREKFYLSYGRSASKFITGGGKSDASFAVFYYQKKREDLLSHLMMLFLETSELGRGTTSRQKNVKAMTSFG